MSELHPIIAITGSSGAGTTSVTRTFSNMFRREHVNAAIIEGDSFHRYDRKAMREAVAAADKDGQTVHGSLTLTVEPTPADGGLDGFYNATRTKQGEAFQIVSHAPWKDGYLDVLYSETPIAESRVRRYYRVDGARGYSLTFEAREDVYPSVYQWCDIIAGTLRIGNEMRQPPQQP